MCIMYSSGFKIGEKKMRSVGEQKDGVMVDPEIKWCSNCNLYRDQDWLVCSECHQGGCACYVESECPHIGYMDEEE